MMHRVRARIHGGARRGSLNTRYGMEIRAPTGLDVPGLAELLATAGHAIPARVLAERLDAMRRQPGAVLIASAWGPPSGLVIAHWYRTLTAPQPVARITSLLVGPDERRRGIGRLLLKAASQAARTAGCDTLELLVTPDREDLREFCLATGFSAAGSRFTRALRKKGGD
jgi:aminoglycoside 6'-N-acetyltransferase I